MNPGLLDLIGIPSEPGFGILAAEPLTLFTCSLFNKRSYFYFDETKILKHPHFSLEQMFCFLASFTQHFAEGSLWSDTRQLKSAKFKVFQCNHFLKSD